MKGLILLILALVVVAGVWWLFFSGPASIAEFAAIEEKYKQPEELAPSSLENIKGYKQEILFLKRKYSGSQETALLADIKIDLAEIEESLILIGNELSKIDRRNPDCTDGGRISKSMALLDAAKKKSLEVESNSQKLESGNKGFADSSGISSDGFKTAVEGISKSIDNIGNIINSYC